MTDPDWRTHYDHPNPWDAVFAPMTLPAMFDASVARRDAAPLTDFYGARLSYAEVGRAADAFAASLQAQGLAKGDRVGLYLPNVPDYLIAYYGALKAGGIVVNLSPLYSRDELAHQLVATN